MERRKGRDGGRKRKEGGKEGREEGWEGGEKREKAGGRAMKNKTTKSQTQAICLPYWLMRPTPMSVEHFES